MEDIAHGITARVQNYIISAEPLGNVTLDANDSSICSFAVCKYSFKGTTETLDSIHITAKNLLPEGYSESQVCSNTTISKINQLIVIIATLYFADSRVESPIGFCNLLDIVYKPHVQYKGKQIKKMMRPRRLGMFLFHYS